ncbi:hypothetical protein, partial [Bradyrhizobium hipponense]|uniref:hypothetical protein n=1 Tax=Bradyrhizobium hipponense TaxID=2605638 RepID=UPI001AEE5625
AEEQAREREQVGALAVASEAEWALVHPGVMAVLEDTAVRVSAMGYRARHLATRCKRPLHRTGGGRITAHQRSAQDTQCKRLFQIRKIAAPATELRASLPVDSRYNNCKSPGAPGLLFSRAGM